MRLFAVTKLAQFSNDILAQFGQFIECILNFVLKHVDILRKLQELLLYLLALRVALLFFLT